MPLIDPRSQPHPESTSLKLSQARARRGVARRDRSVRVRRRSTTCRTCRRRSLMLAPWDSAVARSVRRRRGFPDSSPMRARHFTVGRLVADAARQRLTVSTIDQNGFRGDRSSG